MRLLLTDAQPDEFCYLAAGDTAHPRAVNVVHDERGCVPACDGCTRWRATQDVWAGHHVSCEEAGALAV